MDKKNYLYAIPAAMLGGFMVKGVLRGMGNLAKATLYLGGTAVLVGLIGLTTGQKSGIVGGARQLLRMR
jgi:hypothetical protein